MPKAKPLFKVDWNAAPSDAIGACFNSDGIGWYWNVKPEIKGNEKHPNFLRWRGPEYGQGYTKISDKPAVEAAFAKAHWKDSWQDRPSK